MTNRRSILMYLLGGVVLVATLLGVWGIGAHRASLASAEAGARHDEQERGPRVRVAKVTRAPAVEDLVLQGEARPFATVTLYAKVSGYLRDLRVDKGDRVKANQVIATISSPELEQQYLGAVADAKNKRVNADRLAGLAPSGLVSKQDLDLAQANAEVADAAQSSLSSQRDYRVIRAPFNGVVTARFADPGTLIQSAVNGQSGAVPIVTVSKNDSLRVYVYLDQQSAAFVRVGDVALVRVPERPGFSRKASVTRIAGELAPKTRTMLTEIDVDNADASILPGSYVAVSLQARRNPLIQVPAEAVVLRGDKAFVAVVDGSQKVRYRPIVVADDDGQMVRLIDGPKEGDRVAVNLGNSVEDGSNVQVIESPKPTAAR